MQCPHHKELDDKIDKLTITQTRMIALLEESVVKRGELYSELGKVYVRLNTDKDKSRSMLGVLIGVITLLGGTIGYLLKNMI